jgi:hypothetical protein
VIGLRITGVATSEVPAPLAAPQASARSFGNASTIVPRNGVYVLSLPGGYDFTNPFDPRIPTVGGDPAIVVEGLP